ncbi:serine--tRNA ligase [Ischnura elegans]|uniref:serine--tRNA ligase n=1 Tax=Ischnura elegans TaxID=197161 RepID=UPI001ED895FA|nr:serine--tRNA ligase [Ischnura elegans]
MTIRDLWMRQIKFGWLQNLILRKYVPQVTRGLANQSHDSSLERRQQKQLKPFFGFARKLHELDVKYLCNKDNSLEIQENIRRRKLSGNIDLVQELYLRIQSAQYDEEKEALIEQLTEEALKIPNKLPKGLPDEPSIIRLIGEKPSFEFSPKTLEDLTKKGGCVRTQKLGSLTGKKSYFLCGVCAELEEALVNFAMDRLCSHGFQMVSVPDILPASVIEGCGMNTRGERSQVYRLDKELYQTGPDWGDEVCLSGTSEMALAGMLAHDSCSEGPLLSTDLPLRLCAVSRCYRAEISKLASEKGLYRVHEFTKVEMFGACIPEDSASLVEELINIEEGMLKDLGLHARLLQMGAADLGPQAYSKVDLEVWMPGRAASAPKGKTEEHGWGEVSSCSDCTDFQSRRLGIHYARRDGQKHLVHTVNGTAAAIPRLLIALLETHQNEDQTISIPPVLQPYMRGRSSIDLNDNTVPKTKSIPMSLRSKK